MRRSFRVAVNCLIAAVAPRVKAAFTTAFQVVAAGLWQRSEGCLVGCGCLGGDDICAALAAGRCRPCHSLSPRCSSRWWMARLFTF